MPLGVVDIWVVGVVLPPNAESIAYVVFIIRPLTKQSRVYVLQTISRQRRAAQETAVYEWLSSLKKPGILFTCATSPAYSFSDALILRLHINPIDPSVKGPVILRASVVEPLGLPLGRALQRRHADSECLLSYQAVVGRPTIGSGLQVSGGVMGAGNAAGIPASLAVVVACVIRPVTPLLNRPRVNRCD